MMSARAAAGIVVVAVLAALVTGCTAATNAPSSAVRPSPTRGTPKPLDTAALNRLDQQAASDDATAGRSAVASKTPEAKAGTGKPRDPKPRDPKARGTKAGDWIVGAAGTYVVGRGVPPGTYRSAASPTGRCTWARSKMTKAATEVVIAHGSAAGPITVRIRASDGFFATQGCANWHRIH